jgi:hypothetical protein
MGDGIQGAAQGFDERIKAQATERAEVARQAAIENIKAGMIRNPADASVQQAMQMQGYSPKQMAGMTEDPINDRYGADYDEMAYAQMQGRQGLLEGVNREMASNPYARYGVIGGAALGGGTAMTAGAQKLAQVMGLLDEAQNVEEARDMPLHS